MNPVPYSVEITMAEVSRNTHIRLSEDKARWWNYRKTFMEISYLPKPIVNIHEVTDLHLGQSTSSICKVSVKLVGGLPDILRFLDLRVLAEVKVGRSKDLKQS